MTDPEGQRSEGRRPEGLGRWEPPAGSVVLRSGWRVDPDKASRGYAIAIALGASLIGLWLRLSGGATSVDDATGELLRASLGYRAAPFVVGTTLVAFMGLGTTKRCFGFDRGTLAGLLWVVFAQVVAGWAPGGFWVQVGVGSAAGVVGALLALLVRSGVDARRRALVGVVYFGFVTAAWQLARARYQRWPWLDDVQSAQLAVACGLTLGAALITAPWLWSHSRPHG